MCMKGLTGEWSLFLNTSTKTWASSSKRTKWL